MMFDHAEYAVRRELAREMTSCDEAMFYVD